ncbi:MAG: SDR family NAD(P)-dependent oxidoreductase [Sulfuriferula sp.]
MNKTVLITGASSGIGLEFAQVFASHRYNLVLVARNKARLQDLAAQIKRDFSVTVEIIVKDLTNPSAAQEIFNDTLALGLQIDVLINNAGVGLGGKFTDNSLSDELNLIQLNVVAMATLCHLFGGAMAKRHAGRILNVSSIAAFLPGPLMANYYASKAYVLMLSEALRSELKDSGVGVTALCPGPTRTELFLRSGMSTARAAKSSLSLTAREVALSGYQAVTQNKGLRVVGLINKLLVFSTRLAPRTLLANFARSVNAQHPS